MSDPSSLEQRLALLFTPREAHAGVLALDSVVDEIGASLEPTLNHTVAHTRLVWWREEVARLQRGAPLHPATHALYAAAPQVPFAPLEHLITAAEFQLAGHQPADTEERSVYFTRIYGAPEALRAAVIHGAQDPRLEAFGRALGDVLGTASALETALLDDRRVEAARLRAALERLTPTAELAHCERHGLIRANFLAHRLTDTGLAPPPGALRALTLAWRCARRHRLEFR
jgi:hypothetical protein